jgi:hypothetical protein
VGWSGLDTVVVEALRVVGDDEIGSLSCVMILDLKDLCSH